MCKPLLLLVILALLAGCAPIAPPPTPSAVVTIRFAADGLEQSRYQPIIDAFQQQNPDVRVEFVPFANIAGISSASPEAQTSLIVRAADTAAVLSVNQGDVNQGLLRDLAPFIAADPAFAADDFYAGALERDSASGSVALLPAALRVPLLFYNRDRLAQAGAAPPPTWRSSDMLALAERLTSGSPGAIEHYGLLDQNGWAALGVALAAAGVDLQDPNATPRLDTPAARQALERVVGWVRSGTVLIPAVSAGGGLSQAQAEELLRAGQVGPWSSSYGLNPRTATDLNLPFQVGVLAMPTAPNAPFAHAAGGFVMSSGTQHPEAAWRWLSFLSRQYTPPAPDDGVSLLPARRSLAESSGYWGRLDAEASEAVRASLERIATPTVRGYNWQVLAALAPSLNAVVNQNQPLDAALSQAQADYEQRLAANQNAAATAPTQATNQPVALATATPQAAQGVTSIRFTNIGNSDRFKALVDVFNQQNSDVRVNLTDAQTR
ncbi:MAG: extracellular solute-binding protein, partial [Chloroflexaceae bacterium]|nr:extracellular solute-binding protein [Chloroflexaceae bacterium]